MRKEIKRRPAAEGKNPRMLHKREREDHMQLVFWLADELAIYAVFKNHNEKGIPNLYSLHSWLGIAIIVLYAIQWIYGFIIFVYPGAADSLRSKSLPWHVLSGLFVYILAVGNVVIGFQEKITILEKSGVAKYGPEALLVNFTGVVTVLYGAFVMLSVMGQASGPDNDFSYSAI